VRGKGGQSTDKQDVGTGRREEVEEKWDKKVREQKGKDGQQTARRGVPVGHELGLHLLDLGLELGKLFGNLRLQLLVKIGIIK
jgi:hypothetical protein